MELINQTLLEAGYFRASIESLSDFDKIIGGMAWAMQLFKYEISIDIHYTDSLNLGQKILLTERLVMVLIIMNCPHQVQPHQIVGLDYVNILPVIKWLIGRFMDVRKEHLNRYLESNPQCRAARSLPDEDDDEYQVITYNEPRAGGREFTSPLSKSLDDVKRFSERNLNSANPCTDVQDQGFPRDGSKNGCATSGEDYSTALAARLGSSLGMSERNSMEKVSEDYEESSGTLDYGQLVDANPVGLVEQREEQESQDLHRKLDSELLATNQRVLDLVRKLDCVPSKLEIEQYQSRYIELHQLLIAKGRELRNLYVLFNTLDSSKHYLTKEINLLDSIMSNMPLLNNSESNKSLLIVQLQDIIIKIKSVRNEVVAKLNIYKQKYNSLISDYNRVY